MFHFQRFLVVVILISGVFASPIPQTPAPGPQAGISPSPAQSGPAAGNGPPPAQPASASSTGPPIPSGTSGTPSTLGNGSGTAPPAAPPPAVQSTPVTGSTLSPQDPIVLELQQDCSGLSLAEVYEAVNSDDIQTACPGARRRKIIQSLLQVGGTMASQQAPPSTGQQAVGQPTTGSAGSVNPNLGTSGTSGTSGAPGVQGGPGVSGTGATGAPGSSNPGLSSPAQQGNPGSSVASS